MPSILNSVLVHRQDPAALEAARSLLKKLTSDSRYATAMESRQPLTELLDGLGFGGLWRCSSRPARKDRVKQESFELTGKLVELIVI